jgi:fatty-acyl-CoA synthase
VLRAIYGEFWEQVDLAARAFLVRGVRKGDRVGDLDAEPLRVVVTEFTTARIGAILHDHPRLQAAELEYALRKAGVRANVRDRAVCGQS